MKNKLLVWIISLVALAALVSAAIYTEPWNQNQRGGNYNLTEVDWISANYFNGTLTGEVTGSMNWTKLKNYPVACPAYSAITLLNDSVTCTSYESMSTLNVTGNITSENVYLPAYLSTHTNVSINAVEGVWVNVTFDVHEDSEKEGINHTYNDATNDTFTIVSDGVYQIDYGISFLDNEANPTNTVAIRIIKNNEEIEGSIFEKDTTKQNALGTIYRVVRASLNAGDKIKLQFISNSTTVSLKTEGTYGEHPTSANINLHRIA